MNLRTELHPITADRIDPDAAKVVRRLTRHGYEAYLVGGCVRDLLLGRLPKDFDVSTNATPTEIRKLFRNSRIIGRRFRLAHIFFGRKIIETATFRAAPREGAEADPADLLIWRDNVFGSAEEDAERRDFTINGLFYDLEAKRVLDWVDGLDDLHAGLVRTIGDPDVRFQEDPVRILRAIKFAARLGFSIEQVTARAMIACRGLISRCSVARVLEEIYRLLEGGSARPAFDMLHQSGVLAALFPELVAVLQPPSREAAAEPVPAIRPGRRPRPPRLGEDGSAIAAGGARDDAGFAAPEQDGAALPTDGVSASDADADALAADLGAEQAEVLRLMAALGLQDDDARQQAADRLWRYLEALDERPEGGGAPSRALALGAVFAALLEPSLCNAEASVALAEGFDALMGTMAARLQVSRRDKERLRQMVITQRRLVHGRVRRQLVERDHFPDSLGLLQLRHRATGEHEDALQLWRDAADDKKPRRRKRRRRGRAARTGSDTGSDTGSEAGGEARES